MQKREVGLRERVENTVQKIEAFTACRNTASIYTRTVDKTLGHSTSGFKSSYSSYGAGRAMADDYESRETNIYVRM